MAPIPEPETESRLESVAPPLPELDAAVRVVVVAGNAGVGKTTYGRRLAQTHGMVLLDIDTVSERLVRAGLRLAGDDPNDRDSPAYKAAFRQPIHETLFAIADDNLPHRGCVIVAPFTQERRTPSFLRELQARFGPGVEVHLLQCDETERRRRIVSRDNPRDASKLRDWERYSRLGADPGPCPFPHRLIDTSH